MASEKSTAPGAARRLTTYDEDEREQLAVLRQVLQLHPEALTLSELIRELTGGGSKPFMDVDAVERAVHELVGTGLFHCLGEDEAVRPTRAAVRLYDLWER
ncbi:MAG TPA: hypothetical protein VLK37_09250 [Solirubrobacterales bacterium]|nr:hypothetical protein [Solirubrobacterales bacterium]